MFTFGFEINEIVDNTCKCTKNKTIISFGHHESLWTALWYRPGPSDGYGPMRGKSFLRSGLWPFGQCIKCRQHILLCLKISPHMKSGVYSFQVYPAVWPSVHPSIRKRFRIHLKFEKRIDFDKLFKALSYKQVLVWNYGTPILRQVFLTYICLSFPLHLFNYSSLCISSD